MIVIEGKYSLAVEKLKLITCALEKQHAVFFLHSIIIGCFGTCSSYVESQLLLDDFFLHIKRGKRGKLQICFLRLIEAQCKVTKVFPICLVLFSWDPYVIYKLMATSLLSSIKQFIGHRLIWLSCSKELQIHKWRVGYSCIYFMPSIYVDSVPDTF